MSRFQVILEGKEVLERLAGEGATDYVDVITDVLRKEPPFMVASVTKRYRRVRTSRTGTLARSFESRVLDDPRSSLPSLTVGVLRGPALAYAAAQEYGAEIEAKNVRFLTIPNPDGPAVTQAGVHRYESARFYPEDLVFIGSGESGALYDAGDIAGVDDLYNIEPVYFLVRRVVLPEGKFIREGFADRLPITRRRIADALAEFFAGAT